MSQTIQVTLKEYDGKWSRMTFLPYTIWHNQSTDIVTVRTETGHYKFPAHVIDKIELLQNEFDFTAKDPQS